MNSIAFYHYLRRTGTVASFLLFLLTALAVFPFAPKSKNLAEAIGAPVASESTIAMNVDKASANLEIAPVATSGTFASSKVDDLASFDVTTNNFTGYTLSISSSNDDGELINQDTSATLSSIDSIVSESTFDSTVFNGKWGYMPSKYNSVDNVSFHPAPTTDASTLDVTGSANVESNNYTIGLGARVDYTKPAGTYSNTFILTAVVNPVAYVVNYTDNSGDTDVTNMPDADSATSASTKVALSTRVPSRGAKYAFAGWCDVAPTINADGSSTCNGTIYQPSTESAESYVDFINQTEELSSLTLYATWDINSLLQTVQVRYQNADGTWTNYETYNECTAEVIYGESHSCSIPATTEYQAATLASYTVTSENTKQIDVYRNTRTVTLTKGTGISTATVTGSGVKSGSGTASATVYYGGAVTISASLTSGYEWVNWTGSATYTNQNQSISSVTSNLSFTANGKTSLINYCTQNGVSNANCMQTMTSSNCSGTKTDARDGKTYTVATIGSICWMTKNLDLAGGTKLETTLSHVTSAYTLPASSTSGFSDNSTAYVYNSGRTNCSSPGCYSYYSYVAATAGTGASISSGNATSDICPKGWRLPTQDDLYALVSSYNTGAKLTASPFLGVYAGLYDYSSFDYGGSYGYYWSSAANTSTYAYLLSFYSSNAGVSNYDKRLGRSVRCVLQ